ncbi:hypothetical protein Q9251_03025 [Alkalihalobacillus macyae]|uniref:hypothetical protein n=1 Tax=Guptibacillus hwajinpoensis TaxID=208199 RepID=UPI00273CD8CC|nr:hypothetical protein [Alkalihalobacillus macyae]MDP4549848.1 hypothetical protein [Alkalihalobacillus macyae]
MANDNKELIKDFGGNIPIPQYKDKTTGEYKKHIGDKAPFYQLVDDAGQIIGGTIPINTQLTGSSVPLEIKNNTNTEQYLFNAKALTTVNLEPSPEIDISKYKSVEILALNTHNQPINLGLVLKSKGVSKHVAVWDGVSFKTTASNLTGEKVTIPANLDAYVYLNTRWTWLNNLNGASSLSVVVKPEGAPTSGSITIIVIGVLN